MVPRESLPPSHGEIHGPNHCCGPVDGLRDRDFVERNIAYNLSMSSMVSMATPHRPTSPALNGSSESRPIKVGRSKPSTNQCSLSCPAFSNRYLNRRLVSSAEPKPANWRMVQSRCGTSFVDTTSKWVLVRLANTWMGLAHIIRMGGLNRVGAVTAIDFIPRNSDGFWVGTTDGSWFHALILVHVKVGCDHQSWFYIGDMPPFVSQKLALVLVLCFTAVSEAQLRVATWNCGCPTR